MPSHNCWPKMVHRTIACRAETENINPGLEAWEFTCPYCDYRAGYVKLSSTIGALTIWNQGNPLVRHHNSYASEQKEDTWLTPNLLLQMEALLEDLEMD